MASMLVAEYGYELDPWQQSVLGSWLARCGDDRFAAESCGLAVPRQNGKNTLIEARELYGIVTTGEKFLHTAHEVKTARKAFLRLAGFFEDERRYPELAEMVKSIRRTNGQEAIELLNGGSVEFSARSRGAARGFTVDVVVFDEAQELTDEQLEAILPTLSAAPSGARQFIYTGTPPGPNSPGEVFRRTREAALAGGDDRFAWHEWSVDALPNAQSTFDDVAELCYETNPAIGYRIELGFCKREFNAMSLDGFARERLGWWSDWGRASAAIPKAAWGACATDDPPTTGRKTFAAKFAPDGHAVALVACRLLDDGTAYCELIDERPLSAGIDWLTSFLCRREMARTTAAVAVDGRNGAGALLNELKRVYPRQAVYAPTPKDVADASAMVMEAVRRRALLHWSDDGQEMLDVSATTSVKRPIGHDGGWGFGGDCSTAMEAVALAYWANNKTRRRPGEGARLL